MSTTKKECLVITGATGALGKAVTQHFLNKGYTIFATDFSADAFSELPQTDKLNISQVDLSNEEDAAKFVEQIINKNFTIAAAFLLAGGYAGGSIHDTTSAAITQQFQLNFFTTFHIARPVFEHMKANGQGRMVFMAARPALLASEGKKNVAYGLSKTLLVKLAEYLNAEGKQHNVVTAVVVPGTLDTPANRAAMPNADFSKWTDLNSVAAIFEFLMSEPASVLRETVLKVYNES